MVERDPAKCKHDLDVREFRDGTVRCMVCGKVLQTEAEDST